MFYAALLLPATNAGIRRLIVDAAFSWFTFAWTFCYLVWLGTAIIVIPAMYNCWVQLYNEFHSLGDFFLRLTVYSGLEVLTFVFWLIAMSLLASHAQGLSNLDAFIVTFGPKYEEYYQLNVERYAKSFVAATFTATALSTLNFLLCGVTLVSFGTSPVRFSHNHGQLGNLRGTDHCSPGPARPA